MTEQEAIEKIHSVYPTGKKNGIENMRALMEKLGNVQEGLKMIHVAGTNGKGSTCAMIERMLRAAGYTTGMYTSPYIEVYNERIRINGEPVSGELLGELVEAVWPAVEACCAEGVAVTEFELGTALAFAAFSREKVDAAIIEVGLGGRIDPTNIITPLVSVITGVGMDHMQYLGETIEEIALEKAGILKPGVPLVLGRQEKAARRVLLAAAHGMNLPVLEKEPENLEERPDGMVMDVNVGGRMIRELKVSLCGAHQAENACAALCAMEVLAEHGFAVGEDDVRKGLAGVRWPGRLERFGQVILDGAHNAPGVRALCAYCDKWLPREKTVLLTGMMADKETEHMSERLAQRVHAVVCTTPKIPRAMPAEQLAERFKDCGLPVYAQADSKRALAQARNLAGPQGTVLAAGSLYLIGELRTMLRKEKEITDGI